MMTKEEKIESFVEVILPRVRESVLKIVSYFEAEKLPSAYTACVTSYLENFVAFSAKKWEEHCDDYGVTMEFPAIENELESLSTLDEYVEEFR